MLVVKALATASQSNVVRAVGGGEYEGEADAGGVVHAVPLPLLTFHASAGMGLSVPYEAA